MGISEAGAFCFLWALGDKSASVLFGFLDPYLLYIYVLNWEYQNSQYLDNCLKHSPGFCLECEYVN